MTLEWQPGAYQVAICADGMPVRVVDRGGLICGPFAIGPDSAHGLQLVHIPTASVVAESDSVGRLKNFHEKLMVEFGALDWRRRDLAALTTADHYIRAQRLRHNAGCGP